MKKILTVTAAAAILACLISCGSTPKPDDSKKEETITTPVVQEEKKEEKKEKPAPQKKKPLFGEDGLPIGKYVVMEDFEDGNYWMPVGSSWDDGDMSIDDETTEEWGTNGPTSLKCLYKTKGGEFEKSGYYCDAPLESDWTDAKFVVIDVNNPNDYALPLTIVLQTGDDWTWNQAEPQMCEPGISSLVFDIRSFKDTSYIARMIVYLFGTPESNGFFFFDNYRVVF